MEPSVLIRTVKAALMSQRSPKPNLLAQILIIGFLVEGAIAKLLCLDKHIMFLALLFSRQSGRRLASPNINLNRMYSPRLDSLLNGL